MNRHFERKEFFSVASCKVLCKFLMEVKAWFSLSDIYRIITSMPTFATYRAKVEAIISKVLTAVLWESRAWKLCTFQVRERFPNSLLVIEICLVIPVQTLCHKKGNLWLPVNTWCLYCGSTHAPFLLMVLFLRSIITDWQDENKITKKLGSQLWEKLLLTLQ